MLIPLPVLAVVWLSWPVAWGVLATLLPAAGFIALLVRHARASHQQKNAERLRNASQERRARIDRIFTTPPDAPALKTLHNYAFDLHIDGPFSLMALVDFTRTSGGHIALRDLLQSQPDAEALDPPRWQGRRSAVAELARARVFASRMERSAKATVEAQNLPGRIPFVGLLRLLSIPAWLLPPISIASWILAEYHPSLSYYLLTLPLQLVLFLSIHFLLKRTAAEWLPFVDHADRAASLLMRAAFPFRTETLADFRPAVNHPGKLWNRLARVTGLWNTRRNPLLHVLAGVFLLYEVHVVLALHRILDRRRELERALPRLYRLEALLSLGIFEADAPATVDPELVPGTTVDFQAMTHPLLSSGVPNDITLARAGKNIGIISGSNMSGKSTFLRAVGANLVLAMSGARVFAEKLRFSPVRLFASMTVRDDLSESVSLFLAEVRRLRELFDTVALPGPPVLFLLDEMLRGTNTIDRVRAARSIIEQLSKEHVLGLVATHDPEVMALADESSGIFSGHFQENVTPEGMSFDYTLRPGPASGGNAIRILEQNGIPIQ